MPKHTFKYYIAKIIFTIMGIWKCWFYFRKGSVYQDERKNTYLVYRGKRTFYQTINYNIPGVTYYDGRKVEYKYYVLGIKNYRKINYAITKY
jgi:hypothetical protein